MFRMELSTQIEEISSTYSPRFSPFVSSVSPNGKLEQMVKEIDPANEMAAVGDEVIYAHYRNYRYAYKILLQEYIAE